MSNDIPPYVALLLSTVKFAVWLWDRLSPKRRKDQKQSAG